MIPRFSELVAPQGEASAIREILKLTEKPDILSFAGGLPAAESFPTIDMMLKITDIALRRFPKAMQYAATEGFPPLREALVPFAKRKGVVTTPDEITITTGSQQTLYGLGKLLIQPRDEILVEAPTYLGALQAFNHQKPTYVPVATDADGIIVSSFEEQIERHPQAKFAYLIPNFQNPTGKTIPLERRKQIAQIIKYRGILAIEDDPYGELRYRGSYIPSLYSLTPENVIYVGTLSKVFAPGFRIGFFIAPPEVKREFVTLKQGMDLHTSTFNQTLAAIYLSEGFFDQQLPRIIDLYKPRWEAMGTAIDKSFPAGTVRSNPDGGMFYWVELPGGINATELLKRALEAKLAFVPGQPFFTNPDDGKSCLRLNFTNVDLQSIGPAMKTLGEIALGML